MSNKILFFLFIFFSCNLKNESNSDKRIKVNEKFNITHFDLKSINNKKIEKNKLLLLDFWATWCSPCIASFPNLEEIQERYKNELQIIAISDEEIETVSKYLKKYKVNLTFFNDTTKKLFKLFNIDSRPTSCLISEKGEFLWAGNSKDFDPVLKEYLEHGIISKPGINEFNKQYYTNELNFEQVSPIYQYSISEATDPYEYYVRNRKVEAIDLKYISVPVTEVIKDFFNVDNFNFINNRLELDTLLLNLEAKSRNPKLTYDRQKIKIMEDIQNIYDFTVSRKNKIINSYTLNVKDLDVLQENIETLEGGGVVNRKNGVHEIIRLNLSQLAYYFQKRLKVHIRYDEDYSSKYNLNLKDFKSVEDLNLLLRDYGLSLSSTKREIEFIEIN